MTKSGYFVAFFGPDGSGKSTTAAIFENMCCNRGLSICRYHWRPRILPSLVDVRNIDFDTTHPNDLPARSWILSLSLYIYFFLDFYFAYFAKFCPFLKAGGIIIYERYYYDLLFHPKRYRLQHIRFLPELLTFFIPRPQLMVLLSGKASVIAERKPELPVDEIRRQQNKMMQYLPRFGRVLHIDVTATKPLNVAHMIYSALFDIDSYNNENPIDTRVL